MSGWEPHGPLSPDEQLYFLHVPKTAGTAMRVFLQNHFDADECCPHLVLPALLQAPPSELARYRLIAGHHGMYAPRLLAREPVIVTVLRDPLERAVSHYRHLHTVKEDWLRKRVEGRSFEEFVCSDDGAVELLNFQTRYLAFDDIQADYFGHSAVRARGTDALLAKYDDPTLVERVRERLDRFAFVGVQERFDECLSLLAATLGWAPATGFSSFNRARRPFDPSELTDRARERVEELSRVDRAAHDHARGLFERRLAEAPPERAEALYREAMRRRARTASVRFGFDRAVHGDNWLGVQRPEGNPMRWTGPGTTTTLDLRLELDRPLRVRFLVGAPAADVTDSLRLFANDAELETRRWQMHDPARPQRTFEAVIEPRVLRRNEDYCRLRFEVARAINPSKEWPGNPETRTLALSFFWLEIGPA